MLTSSKEKFSNADSLEGESTTILAVTTAGTPTLSGANQTELIIDELSHMIENIESEESGDLFPDLINHVALLKVKLQNPSGEQYAYWNQQLGVLQDLTRRLASWQEVNSRTKFSFAGAAKKQTTQFKLSNWADEGSSSEEEDDTKELYSLIGESSTSTGIYLPADFQTIWPKGYNVIYNACISLGLTIHESQSTFKSSGFKDNELFSGNIEVARAKFALCDEKEQTAINTFKAVVLFLHLTPNETLASDSKFALAASYVLHHLLKTGDSEIDAKTSNSLKHRDGGRAIILGRMRTRFSSHQGTADVIMTAVEKIARENAKRFRAQNRFDTPTKLLVIKHCYTSPAGMLEHFYTKERRKEFKRVEKINTKGKLVVEREEHIVNGHVIPSLCSGSDLLKTEEKLRLKRFDRSYNLPDIMFQLSKSRISNGGDVESLSTLAEEIVGAAYALTSNVTTVLKQRKRTIRAMALKASSDGKITQAEWLAATEKVVFESIELDHSLEGKIESFLITYKV